MPIIDLPTAKIYFEVWGDHGPWVTLINGHLRPLTDFRMFGQRLVAAGYKVIALDQRGSGQTVVNDSFSIQDMVEDVKAIWEQIGCEHSVVLGISMGGFISQELANNYPKKVGRLILMSTGSTATVLNRENTVWDKDPEKVQSKLSAYFAPDFVRRNPLIVQSMSKQIARAAENELQKQRAVLQRQAILQFDSRSYLAALKVPTLVIHGEDDMVIPLEEGKKLASWIPGAQLTTLPNTGHLILAERPRELLEIFLAFCQKKDGSD